MPYWTLTIHDLQGREINTQHVDISPAATSSCWIEGTPANPETWQFTPYDEHTQARSDWVGQFEFHGGAVKVSTDLPDTYIKSPPPHPMFPTGSRVLLPYSLEPRQYFALIRDGDVIEFENSGASVEVIFHVDDRDTQADMKVEVTSSRPLVIDIKDEPSIESQDREMSRHGAQADESQHLYSTGRERQSPTPRPQTANSQIIRETPNRRRMRSQAESAVFDSVREASPTHVNQSDNVPTSDALQEGPSFDMLPDVQDKELPNTLPDSYGLQNLFSEPGTDQTHKSTFGGGGSNDTDERVDKLVRDLNASQSEPPSEDAVTTNDVSLTGIEEPTEQPDEPPSDRSTEEALELPAPKSPEVTTDMARPGSEQEHNSVDVTDVTPHPPSNSKTSISTPNATIESPARSTKRKKIRDYGSTGKATKRARLISEEISNHGGDEPSVSTPASSAPRRSSPRIKSFDAASESSSRRYTGPAPKILFSNTNVPEREGLMKFLKSHKATKSEATTAKGSNFLCVGKGELKTTAKLLHSLTQGKTIVTDDWVLQSSKEKMLLNPAEFIPQTLKDSQDKDRSQVFSKQIVYVTPALRLDYGKGWDDIQAIIRQAGGTNPLIGPLNKLKDRERITLYVGSESNDSVVAELQTSGLQVYKKEVIAASIVHGDLLLDDESLLLAAAEAPEKLENPKKGRRKK